MQTFAKAGLVVACLSVAIVGFALNSGKKNPTVLESVQGYQKWTKANPKPVRLSTGIDLLCRGILPNETERLQAQNPHFGRFITVYVNSIGEKAMLKGGEFPVGSVIVKEKLNRRLYAEGGGEVALSTVMVKRDKGYNPTCGDWEFSVIDATASKTNGEGRLENCMKCHQDVAKQGYVFRTYVGAKEWGSPSGWNVDYRMLSEKG